MSQGFKIGLLASNEYSSTLEEMTNAIVTEESVMQVYGKLDECTIAALNIEDEETIDEFLRQHRTRKLICGSYLLRRDYIICTSQPIIDKIVLRWNRLIEDGLLVVL
jgi:hypothetical protein